jgi:hypothetical protein
LLALGYDYGSTSGPNQISLNNGNLLVHTINPTNAATPTFTQTYVYDALNRLKLAAENPANVSNPACPDANSSWCEQFNDDQFGNRLVANRSKLGASQMEPAGFDSNNHILPVLADGSAAGWLYDASGHIIRDASFRTYAWDAEGRMVAFCPLETNPANCTNEWAMGQTVYSYDGEGRRVAKQATDGTLTTYVYDGWPPSMVAHPQWVGPFISSATRMEARA